MRMLFVLLAAVPTYACTGDSHGPGAPSPQCSPPPSFQLMVEINGTNAQSLAGDVALARLVDGTGPLVCSSSVIAASGTFQITFPEVSTFNPNPTLELILNSGSDAAYGVNDHHYAFHPANDGCMASESWNVVLDYTTAAEAAVTWPLGTRC